MITSLRMAAELMTPGDRRSLARLLPLMVVASAADVVTVVFAATFFRVLAEPDAASPTMVNLLGELGLTGSALGAMMAALVLLIVIGTNTVSMFTIYRVNLFGMGQVFGLSRRTLGSMLNQDYSWFLGQNTAKLKQLAIVETQRVVMTLIVNTTQIAARTVGALIIVAWLFINDPLTTATLGIGLSTFYGIFYLGIRRTMANYGRERSTNDRSRHQIVEESLVGIKELKLLGLEHIALLRFDQPNRKYTGALAGVATVQASGKPALEVVGVIGLVLVVLAFQFTGRPLTGVLAAMATYAVAAYRLLPTVQLLFQTALRIQVESDAVALIHQQNLKRPDDETQLSSEMLPFEEAVELKQIHYRYPGATSDVLRDIDIRLEKGSWTAIVGTTGSGKTTLVDLLMGLLRPTSGTVSVDDSPLTADELRKWQRHIGYVPQSLFMNDASVARNIAFGNPNPDEQRVRECARVAQADQFIETDMEQGYDTRVGDRGMRLSGGQRQRLGIARALYRKPSLLVLDEATSALDNRTESAVVDALRKDYADTTVVMIAHRLSTTRYCDQIIMLERGVVIDIGSYDALMQRNPLFVQMVNTSQSDAEQR